MLSAYFARGNGDAGDLEITATDSISISGQRLGLISSSISSTPQNPTPAMQQATGADSRTVSGNAGSITLHTQQLEITNSGELTVANLAEGDAEQITVYAEVYAENIEVREATIIALTTFGESGNILLNVQDILFLQDGQIQASANGSGNGGNITINSPLIVGIEDSNIAANAVLGDGGNIDIAAREIFGLAFREIESPETSDITASSEFGVSGTVSIGGFSLEADAGLSNLPTEVSDESDRIVKGCGVSQGSQFIASGRGGLNMSPIKNVPIARIWQDIRPSATAVSLLEASTADSAARPLSSLTEVASFSEMLPTELLLVPAEATGFQKTESGVALIAEATQAIAQSHPTCIR